MKTIIIHHVNEEFTLEVIETKVMLGNTVLCTTLSEVKPL